MPRGKYHTYNKTFFGQLTPDCCYLAGFIASDGYLSTKYQVKIGLKGTDGKHLEKFIPLTEFTGIVSYKEFISRGSVYNKADLVWSGAQQWFIDLAKNFNIINKKSLILTPPNLNDDVLKINYIAGYIDGDGSLSMSLRNNSKRIRARLNIYGTEAVLQWIKNTFSVPGSLHKHKMIYCLSYGKTSMDYIRELVLQYVNNTLLMERKWNFSSYRRKDGKSIKDLLNEGYLLS